VPDGGRSGAQRRGVRQPSDVLRALRPVETTRLADRVVAQIQDIVLDEGLESGDRLPSERDLAARLGTSRAIVSQALRTLSLMGLVEVRQGSGAYVTRNPGSMMLASLDLLVRSHNGSVSSLAELRYWLESIGATNALRAADDADVEQVQHAFDRMATSVGRISEWIATDTMFHAAVVAAAGNPYLGAVYESVHTQVIMVTYEQWVERSEPPTWLRGAQWKALLDLHRPIVEALRQRDHSGMERALLEHHEALLEHLARRDRGSQGTGPSGRRGASAGDTATG